MFGRATITLGIGPHSSYNYTDADRDRTDIFQEKTRMTGCKSTEDIRQYPQTYGVSE